MSTSGRRPVSNMLGLAILGLLHEQPMHPHGIAAELRGRGMDRSFKLRTGSLYDTVRALERAGWIEAQEKVQIGARPERTIYAPTADGRTAFVDWIDELVREPRDEFPTFGSAVTYLGALGTSGARSALRERARRLRTEIDQLRAEHQDALGELEAAGHPRLFVLEVEYALHMQEAELAWVERTIDEIDAETLTWPADLVTGSASL
ncbi:PadR family transcriptional regulator [Phytoactinopolyspora limicola]|uniref:PadR family transcriptional regulator n=1 Tax=Phytoactinopolyspora limicola TaxID=2715536 RepID=UPI00140DBACD|nr:PadR family transcriptional regulator [Phytoactinopolyspora limicola]